MFAVSEFDLVRTGREDETGPLPWSIGFVLPAIILFPCPLICDGLSVGKVLVVGFLA